MRYNLFFGTLAVEQDRFMSKKIGMGMQSIRRLPPQTQGNELPTFIPLTLLPSGVVTFGGTAMSLTEVLPEVRMLSRFDKIRLIQFLAQELGQEEENLIEPGQSYPVWSPDQAFTAAAALLQALEDEKGRS
jgi:hypothetical protein